MADSDQILPNGGRAPGQRQVVYGNVSRLQPAPSDFTDPLFVTLPFNPTHAYRVMNWPVIHGATLPALGADVLVIFDDRKTVRVPWWDGVFS